jgi:hypothetical protein
MPTKTASVITAIIGLGIALDDVAVRTQGMRDRVATEPHLQGAFNEANIAARTPFLRMFVRVMGGPVLFTQARPCLTSPPNLFRRLSSRRPT